MRILMKTLVTVALLLVLVVWVYGRHTSTKHRSTIQQPYGSNPWEYQFRKLQSEIRACESQFVCQARNQNGKCKPTCIPRNKLCDNHRDYLNGEDEVGCEERETACKPLEFICFVGGVKTCLSSHKLCDNTNHCADNADEINCERETACKPLEFTCFVGGVKSCLPSHKLCDKTIHCDDNADEINCGSRSTMYDTWTLVACTSETGEVTNGSKSDLIEAVMSGADVRIQYKGSGYLTSVQNAHVLFDNLCVQSLFHISKETYDTHQDAAYRQFLYVCTTGNVHVARYFVGSHTHPIADNSEQIGINWFVRSMTNTPVKLTGTLAVISGSVAEYVDDVTAASDVRLVDEYIGYATSIDSVELSLDNTEVVAQSIHLVSPLQVGVNFQFLNDAYYTFTNYMSDSSYQITSWAVGEHQTIGDDGSLQPMTYHTDTNWQLAYRHDANGIAEEGSLEALRMAVLMGHRVKVQYDQVTVEPDEVQVIGDQVNAVVLSMITKDQNNFKIFPAAAIWDWRVLATDGTEDTVMLNVGEYNEQGRTTGTRPLAWYTDTRPWTMVLENSDTGSVISGSKAKLIEAINKGARVRYTQRFANGNQATIIHEADNLAIDGTEVAAQHVRSVGLKADGNNGVAFKDENDLYWLFTISSTTGKVDISKWVVGNYEDLGHDSDQAEMQWFVDVDDDVN